MSMKLPAQAPETTTHRSRFPLGKTANKLTEAIAATPKSLLTVLLFVGMSMAVKGQSHAYNFYPSWNLFSLEVGLAAQDKVGGSTYPRRFENLEIKGEYTKLLPSGLTVGAELGYVSPAKGEPTRTNTSWPLAQVEGWPMFTNDDNTVLVIPGAHLGAQFAHEGDGLKQLIFMWWPDLKILYFIGENLALTLNAEANIGKGSKDGEKHASIWGSVWLSKFFGKR